MFARSFCHDDHGQPTPDSSEYLPLSLQSCGTFRVCSLPLYLLIPCVTYFCMGPYTLLWVCVFVRWIYVASKCTLYMFLVICAHIYLFVLKCICISDRVRMHTSVNAYEQLTCTLAHYCAHLVTYIYSHICNKYTLKHTRGEVKTWIQK